MKIISPLIFVISISSCITFYSGKEIIEINDDYMKIIFKNNNKEKNVYSLYLKIETNIKGKVLIEWNNGEKIDRTIILENNDKNI
jgi:hypothetical protein